MLYALLGIEFVLRLCVEIRERRITQLRGGVFAVLRLILLVNDIVPLPESRAVAEGAGSTETAGSTGNAFEKMHEQGHKFHHHAILRNLFKIILLLLAVWLLVGLPVRTGMPLWQAVLWLHLAAVPFRVIFHLYCWNQEYEADRYAFDKTDRKVAKHAMRALAETEIPYTKLFAVLYREHPTASSRSYRLLHKEIKA